MKITMLQLFQHYEGKYHGKLHLINLMIKKKLFVIYYIKDQ